MMTMTPVSYTHLDVYKRQRQHHVLFQALSSHQPAPGMDSQGLVLGDFIGDSGGRNGVSLNMETKRKPEAVLRFSCYVRLLIVPEP